MKPLLDGDILIYEIAYCGEFKDGAGNPVINSFDNVAELLDKKIRIICEEVEATEKPTLYITADENLVNQLLRRPIPGVSSPAEWKENFRMAIGVTKGYKATRKSSKPFHFYNLRAYMLATYDCVVVSHWEADDQMVIDQYINISDGGESPLEKEMTVICTRDKDLRMAPGWHYSWECGKQAAIGPVYVGPDELGWLEEKDDGKIIGYGPMFFYYQLLVGDNVDNIPGCSGIGPKKAYPALVGLENELDMWTVVCAYYLGKHGDNWREYLMEQAHLLWMVRAVNMQGDPVMWEPPKLMAPLVILEFPRKEHNEN